MAKERVELKFEIIKTLGVLSTNEKGWSVELNLVAWNEKEPKYDLRAWNKDHTRMGKGVTLTQAELDKLSAILSKEEK